MISFTDFLMLVFGILFIVGMIVSGIHDWKQDDKIYQEEKKRKNIEAAKLNCYKNLNDQIVDLKECIDDLNNRMDQLFDEINDMKGEAAYVDHRSTF